jgi:hypothetical protein
MYFQNIFKITKSLKALTLLLLVIPSFVIADQYSKSGYDKDHYQVWEDEAYYDNKSSDEYNDKADYKDKYYHNKHWSDHDHEKKWKEHIKEARSHFRMRLRELFRYIHRITAALKDPDTDWDSFDWGWYKDDDESSDDDSSGDDSTDDDSTGDDSTGDDSTGDDSTGDDSTGDDSTGDDSTNDDSTGDDSTGDDSTGDDSSGDDSTGDDTTGDDSSNDNSLLQSVSVSNQPLGLLGENVVFDIAYIASDDNNQLSGLGLRVHFDSSILTLNSISDILQQDIIVSGEGPVADAEDFDNDPQTDSYITFGWASLFNNWPNTAFPSVLAKITFGISGAIDLEAISTTAVNFTGITTAAGYQFESQSYALELSETETTWDFDGNGDADALTDGLIMMRYSFGLRGDSMANNAMASDSQMSVSQVEERLTGAMKIADIDDDGKVDALTDGLLLLRHLFAMDDESFSHGAVAHSASRKTKHALKHHLNKYMPKKKQDN